MIQGYVHPDFSSVGAVFARIVRSERVGGGGVCVYHEGDCVVDVWGGDMNAAGDPWREDTLSMSMSTTKGVASTAMHILADRGLIEYDAPVARYWPEFGQNGKERVTVRQLMCHEAGLHGLRGLVEHADRILDDVGMAELLAAAAPAHEPGTRNAYHGITYGWLVGEVVRRVAGKSIGEFVQAEIAMPLGLDGLYIGVPASEAARVASLTRSFRPLHSRRLAELLMRSARTRHVADAFLAEGIFEVLWSQEVVAAELAGAAGCFTARSLARMYAALSCGGSLDGTYLVSGGTVAEMGRLQNRRPDLVIGIPIGWRLGYHSIFSTSGLHPRAFGHLGYGGSGAWADPSRRLAVAFVNNRLSPLADPRVLRLGGAAVRAADRR